MFGSFTPKIECSEDCHPFTIVSGDTAYVGIAPGSASRSETAAWDVAMLSAESRMRASGGLIVVLRPGTHLSTHTAANLAEDEILLCLSESKGEKCTRSKG